jgi:subtilisin family serine protease
MRDRTKSLITSVILISLTLIASLFVIFSDVQITGFSIRLTPDYQQYKEKMTSTAFVALESSSMSEVNDFIVLLSDFDSGLELIYDVISKDDVRELEFVNAVAISAKKSQLTTLLNNENISKIYLDQPVTLLRDSALETINLASIRTNGPASFNKTGNGIKIAIIDSGVEYNHSEFNCVVGNAGCFIARAVSLTNNTMGFIKRNSTVNSFNDNTDVKLLNLNTGSKSASFTLYGNHTIKSASLKLNQTENITIELNGVSITPNSTINMSQAIVDCNKTECNYNLIFSGLGKVLLTDLIIDYSFYSHENIGSGMDYEGHGTMVAGILHSVVPDIELYSYRVLDSNNFGKTTSTISAIELAIKDDVDIISMSIGIKRELYQACDISGDFEPLYNALKKAYDKGILLVAASGNNQSQAVHYPACFDNVVAIGSISKSKNPSSTMSAGREIEFTMPGESIYSTFINNTYATLSGTSFATPFASGVFAIAKQAYYENTSIQLSPSQLRDIAKDNAETLHLPGRDNLTGYGMLDVNLLLTGLLNSINIFSNIEEISFSDFITSTTLEITTNSLDDIEITLDWNNLGFNTRFGVNYAINVSLLINGYNNTNSLKYNISVNNPLYLSIEIPSSELIDLQPGVYSSLINIEGNNEVIEVPISLSYTGLPSDFSFNLGLFGIYDKNNTYNYSLNTVYLNYFNFKQGNLSNYNPHTLFNIGDYFNPLLAINSSSTNVVDNYYIKVDKGGSELDTLIVYSNNTVSNYTYYDFKKNHNVEFSSIYDLIYFRFNETGNYNVTLIAELDGNNITLDKKEIQILDNLTINLNDGLLFFDEDNKLDFSIIDNRGYDLTKSGYDYASETIYGSSELNLSLHGIKLNFTSLDSDVILWFNDTIFSEGMYYLGINYTTGENKGFFNDIVTLSYPLKVSASLNKDELDLNNNITLSINLSKKGSIPINTDTVLSINDECKEYVSINISSFTLQNIKDASINSRKALIYQTKPNGYKLLCKLNIVSNVSGNYGLYYTNIDQVEFLLSGSTLPLDIAINVSNQKFQGEFVVIPVNITNNGSEIFTIKPHVLIHGAETSLIYSGNDISINPGQSVTFNANTHFTTVGNNNIEVVLNNSIYTISKIKPISILDNYISTTFSRNLSKIYLNDTFTITARIKNNNDKQVLGNVIMDYSFSKLGLISSTSNVFSLYPEEIATMNYTVRSKEGGTGWISITTNAEQYSKLWNYSFIIKSGYLVEIDLTNTFRKYTFSMEDTIAFTIDDNCDDVFTECKKTCTSLNRECNSICRNELTAINTERNTCKTTCNGLTDKSARDSCISRCESDYDSAKKDNERCSDDCSSDLKYCETDCDKDYKSCVSDSVDVELYVDDVDLDMLFFEVDSDRSRSGFTLIKGTVVKLDLNNDGYYETEAELIKLIGDETYTCKSDCEDKDDNNMQKCTSAKTQCNMDCNRFDGREQRVEKNQCNDDCEFEFKDCEINAKFDLEDCLFYCDDVFSHYELNIRRIEPERIIINHTTNCTTNWSCTNFTECNESNQRSRVCTDLNECDLNNLTKIEVENCIIDDIDENGCNRQNPHNCLDEVSCISAYAYWYDDACHSVRKPDITVPVDPTPPPVTPPPDPERPVVVKDSLGMGIIIFVIFIIILLSGLVIGGYLFINSKQQTSQLYSVSNNPHDEKREKLMDYFMKQLEKGNNINYIAAALKKLGWDATDVDSVGNEIMSDPAKRQIVFIVKFALESGVSDPAMLKQRFVNISPEIVQQAIDELTKRKSNDVNTG